MTWSACNWLAAAVTKPKKSAAAAARRGRHAPKIMMARARKPRPALMPAFEGARGVHRQEDAGQAGQGAGEGDIDQPHRDDVDAGGVGGRRVFTDGPGAQAPGGLKSAKWMPKTAMIAMSAMTPVPLKKTSR